MKLNPLQRWAYKLGVPLSLLNDFAEAYYGYAIPNAEGRYPDWWYIEQGIPTSYRDIEVPKEILKKSAAKGEMRPNSSPRAFVRVEQGRVVEVLSNGVGISTTPYLSISKAQSSGAVTGSNTAMRQQVERQIAGNSVVDTDEIVRRVLATMKTEEAPRLARTTSAPTMNRAHHHRQSDIMSFIYDDKDPHCPAPNVGEQIPTDVDPSLRYSQNRDLHAIQQRKRISSSARHFTPPARSAPGPALPNSPRPALPVMHQRNDTTLTNNSVLGYYSSPIPEYTNLPASPYYSQQNRVRTAMAPVQEDSMSEWSGYNTADETESVWEDETPIGRTAEYRRAAAERLARYRQEV